MPRASKLAVALAAFAILASLGLTAFVPGPAAAGDDDWTEINQWGFEIKKSGNYRVVADLTAPAQGTVEAGILIWKADDVTLDLNGKTLTGRPTADGKSGEGTAIQVNDSEDLVIKGTQATIKHCLTAMMFSDCKDVKIDGQRLSIHHNAYGMNFDDESSKIEITGVQFSLQRFFDCMFDQATNVTLKNSLFNGGSAGGAMFGKSEKVNLLNVKFGRRTAMTHAVVLVDCEEVAIRKCDLGRCTRAIVITGGDTQDISITYNRFGEPAANDCDLQVAGGAPEPQLAHNEPENLHRCD